MAAVTWADVILLVPSVADVSVPTQDEILDYVNTAVNAARLGGEDAQKTRKARIYLAGHMGEMELRAAAIGAGGEVQQEQISSTGLEVTYANFSRLTAPEALQETASGRAYARVTAIAGAPFVVR